MVIDTRSCINAILQKLELKVEPLLNPYYVTWVTNTKLKVDKQCLVTFEIDKLKEIVMCDVLLVKPCHIFWVGHGYGIAMHTMLDMPILILLLKPTRSAFLHVQETAKMGN